ncbi:unnamed protein product [Symbiodinium sp. CCMP2592]|nr:unnamed protein product [Symbiodinium sp. CCMP2592]
MRRVPPPAWTAAAAEILVAIGGQHELAALANAAGQTPEELLGPACLRRHRCETRCPLANARAKNSEQRGARGAAEAMPDTQTPATGNARVAGPTLRNANRSRRITGRFYGKERGAVVAIQGLVHSRRLPRLVEWPVESLLLGVVSAMTPGDEDLPPSPGPAQREHGFAGKAKAAREPRRSKGSHSKADTEVPELARAEMRLAEMEAMQGSSRPGTRDRDSETASQSSRQLHAPGAPPITIIRLLHANADCEPHDAAALAPEVARATPQLSALPAEAPSPLSAAVLVCMTADGYLSAPARSALLEADGGAALAADAQARADDVRDSFALRLDRASAVPTCTAEADAAWGALDAVDLTAELRHPVPTLQDVPPFLRAAVRGSLVKALTHLHAALVEGEAQSSAASRAWKLFLVAPRMLLARPEHQGAQGRAILPARAQPFQRGEWTQLLAAARPRWRPETALGLHVAVLAERNRERACTKVRQGDISRARHVLTAAELAREALPQLLQSNLHAGQLAFLE